MIINLYAPNGNQQNFYKEHQQILTNRNDEEYCVMGDFSAVFNNDLDTKSEKKQ